MKKSKIEEPRRKQRGFFVGMEYVNRIVRLDPAINSGDCGEHPFKTLAPMIRGGWGGS